MSPEIFLLRDSLSRALEKLLDERDAAIASNNKEQETTAQAEAERISVLLSNVQIAINNDVAMRLDIIAERLEDSIEAQQAVGLKDAIPGLQKMGDRLKAAGNPGGSNSDNDGTPAPSGPVVARPGPKQGLVQQIIDGAVSAKLDPIAVLAIVAIESDFRPQARSPLSSAGGLFQFIDGTWKENGGAEHGSGGKGNGHASHAPVDEQIKIGTKFIKKNADSLKRKLGRAPTPTSIYMAHQQGLGSALKLLQGIKSAPVTSVISSDAASNNGLAGKTIGQAIDKFNRMVRSHIDEVMPLIERQAPASDGEDSDTDQPAPVPGQTNSVADRIAELALSEMEQFARRRGSTIKEGEEPLRSRVATYFSFVGMPGASPTGVPWSAAYISFVMRNGGLTAGQFPKSANHAKYILQGMTNTINNKLDASIVYYDIDEIEPRVGDLIGFSRTAAVRNRADIMRQLPDKFFASHTDLVIDVREGRLTAIGGNVSNTIKQTFVDLDETGKLQTSKYFFILRINA